MTEFACETVATIDQLAIHDNTRTDTRAERNHNEILHATRHAIDHFADGGSVGVVGQGDGDAEALLEHFSQWHNAVAPPRKVRRKLNRAVVVVAVWCTNAHRLDFLDAAHLIDNRFEGLHRSIDIVLYIVINLRLDSGCGLDFATAIDDSKH